MLEESQAAHQRGRKAVRSVQARNDRRGVSEGGRLASRYPVGRQAEIYRGWKSVLTPRTKLLQGRPNPVALFLCMARRGPQAGLETEITPEMVEAGFRVLCNPGIADDYLEADKLLLAEIYRAMSSHYPREIVRSTENRTYSMTAI